MGCVSGNQCDKIVTTSAGGTLDGERGREGGHLSVTVTLGLLSLPFISLTDIL